MRIVWAFIICIVLVACNQGNNEYLRKILSTQFKADNINVTLKEDINSSKPKTLLIDVVNPKPENYELDFELVASKLAYSILDSLAGERYNNTNEIQIRFFMPKDTATYSYSIAALRKAEPYVKKALQFTTAFTHFDTLTANMSINVRYVPQDEMLFSMETPMLQKDTFGMPKKIMLLGFKPSVIERNGELTYEVSFALWRSNKITEFYQVVIGQNDTLVDGYSWQFPIKK